MGYYTSFELHFQFRPPLNELQVVPLELRQKVVDAIAARTGNYIRFDVDGYAEDSYKWYDWHDDMLAVSKQFPSLLLTLYGDGEESDDKWISYFLDGKVQGGPAEIVYPEFDETAFNTT